MSEIKLNMRYPESRLEDVTDAYMRGFEVGIAMRTDENARLRELMLEMVEWAYISDYCDLEDQFADRMRELGVEV